MRTTGLLLFVSAFLAFTWLTSCSKMYSIEGNGHVTMDTRVVPDFSNIKSMGNFSVYIIQDSLYRVYVEAEENLQPYIETEVSEHTLLIKVHERRNIDNNYPVRVYVHTPDISGIELSGSGSIACDKLTTQNLDINLSGSGSVNISAFCNTIYSRVSGSGHITLSGESGKSDFNISGSGKINAYSLITESCFADISGSGSMYLTVKDFLDVSISGSGKVYYQGNASVTTHITGSGSVIHN